MATTEMTPARGNSSKTAANKKHCGTLQKNRVTSAERNGHGASNEVATRGLDHASERNLACGYVPV